MHSDTHCRTGSRARTALRGPDGCCPRNAPRPVPSVRAGFLTAALARSPLSIPLHPRGQPHASR